MGRRDCERGVHGRGLIFGGRVVRVDHRRVDVFVTHPSLDLDEVHPGRRESVPYEWRRSWKRTRDGWSLQRIADQLNADGIPTARGGSEWRPSSVRAILNRKDQRRRYPVAP
jgi:Recombinase